MTGSMARVTHANNLCAHARLALGDPPMGISCLALATFPMNMVGLQEGMSEATPGKYKPCLCFFIVHAMTRRPAGAINVLTENMDLIVRPKRLLFGKPRYPTTYQQPKRKGMVSVVNACLICL